MNFRTRGHLREHVPLQRIRGIPSDQGEFLTLAVTGSRSPSFFLHWRMSSVERICMSTISLNSSWRKYNMTFSALCSLGCQHAAHAAVFERTEPWHQHSSAPLLTKAVYLYVCMDVVHVHVQVLHALLSGCMQCTAFETGSDMTCSAQKMTRGRSLSLT